MFTNFNRTRLFNLVKIEKINQLRFKKLENVGYSYMKRFVLFYFNKLKQA